MKKLKLIIENLSKEYNKYFKKYHCYYIHFQIKKGNNILIDDEIELQFSLQKFILDRDLLECCIYKKMNIDVTDLSVRIKNISYLGYIRK